jgi:hypothetical protein
LFNGKAGYKDGRYWRDIGVAVAGDDVERWW